MNTQASPLNVVATIEAKIGKGPLVEAALRAVLAPTRAEAGCIYYDLHVDIENPLRLVMLEKWRSKEDLDAHMTSAHLAQLLKTIDGHTASLNITRLKAVA